MPASASTCTGRSAPPSAPTATSTAMCARAASTRRASFAAYLRELRHWAELAPGRSVGSIFFGGGTPSLMSAATVAAILDAIARHWERGAGAEITLEANPSSVEAAPLPRLSRAPASIACRSACSRSTMPTCGHWAGCTRVEEALAAIDVSRETFERFSFDLIYARPGQTPASLARTSWRGRWRWRAGTCRSTSSPSSRARRSPSCMRAASCACPTASGARFYELTQEMTEAAGLPAYEISNHAAPGEESRHNLLYWRYGEYAGHRPRRARPRRGRRRRAAPRRRSASRSAGLALRRGGRATASSKSTPLEPSRAGRRGAADGAAADRRPRPRPLGRLSGLRPKARRRCELVRRTA